MAILDSERDRLEKLLILKKEMVRRFSLPLYQYKPCDDPARNQLAFHESMAFWRLLFGGNQSGKSIAAAAEIAWFATGLHPYREITKPQKIYVLSAEYRTIYEGIWRHLRPDGKENNGMGFLPPHLIHRIGPKPPQQELPSWIEVKFKDHTADHPRISRIDFISGQGKEDARRKLQSAAINLGAIDEEVEEDLIAELQVRTLATDGCLIGSMTLLRSEEWTTKLEERFDDGDEDVFITRLNTDKNEHLSDKQKDRVFKGMSDDEIEIRKYGRSKRRYGLVYPQFSVQQHCVEPFDIPLHWQRFAALDAGFRIFAGLWWALDPETKRFYCYNEMYLREIENLKEVADYVKLVETGTSVIKFIDPATLQTPQNGGKSVYIQLVSDHGLSLIPAFNAVESGIFTVKNLLTPIDGKPTVYFFDTLRHFRSEIKSYKYKPDTSTRFGDTPKDTPIKKKDHIMDCLRYLANSTPQSRPKTISQKLSSYQYGVLNNIDTHIEKLLADRNKGNGVSCPYLGTNI